MPGQAFRSWKQRERGCKVEKGQSVAEEKGQNVAKRC